MRLDVEASRGSFQAELARAIRAEQPGRVVVAEPGEWRVLEDIASWRLDLGVPVRLAPDDRFFISRAEFRT